MVLQRLKIYFFFLILFLASFFGSIFIGSFCIMLFILKPTWYRSTYDCAIGAWEWLAAGLLEKFLCIKIVITGDVIDPDEQSLILMNHRTCFDWMYFWSVLIRRSVVKNEKIVLKSSLKGIPGAGWAMQEASFFFLERKWEVDKAYLDVILDYFKDLNYKTQILLFPEGTDFNDGAKVKSRLYAEATGLPTYEHVLHPRTTGFVHIADKLRKAWDKVNIYDITISFDTTPPQNEGEMIKGILPNKIFFHIKRYSLSGLTPEQDLAFWLQQLWAEKENFLSNFYKNNVHPPRTDTDPLYFELMAYSAICFWFLFIGFSLYICYWSSYILAFVLIQCVVLALVTQLGGLELLTAKYKTHVLY